MRSFLIKSTKIKGHLQKVIIILTFASIIVPKREKEGAVVVCSASSSTRPKLALKADAIY